MSFVHRHRRLRGKGNLGYNSSIVKMETFNAVAVASYVPPVPVYPVSYAPAPSNLALAVGSTGDWTFQELSEMDGASLLNLLYRSQQVHTFLST
jgi:hypothetical protein